MITQFARTEKIIGSEGIKHLQSARVILFGVGGVGSYVAEALVRTGVGHITLVDKDVVDETNLNRQLIALHTTIGEEKVAVATARYREINPEMTV
ncbi:MAG: ThiF family adenylyltransferase, partial [Eubacterium sp.]